MPHRPYSTFTYGLNKCHPKLSQTSKRELQMGAFFQIEDLLFQIEDLLFQIEDLCFKSKTVPMYKSETTLKGPICVIF